VSVQTQRLTLKPGDPWLIAKSLGRTMVEAEAAAADEFWYAHLGKNPDMRIEAREYMNLHLQEFRRCHELRAKLS
jgi:hypothetical protein